MKAQAIKDLLAAKHAKDVFFEEVNLGSAHADCQRLDAWAMPRSWLHWTTHGYEVKVSRADFLRDNKWHAYRKHVEHMWFVCPHGLIQPTELPDGVGLLWASKTGTRLYTKRKAAKGEADAQDALIYLLMSRTRPTNGLHDPYVESADYWRRWLEIKRENRDLGRVASAAIRERAHSIERENTRLRAENEKLQAVKRELDALGVDGWDPVGSLRRMRERGEQIVDKSLRWHLRTAHEELGRALTEIERLENTAVIQHA